MKSCFLASPLSFTLSASDDVVRVTEQQSMLLNLIFRQHLPPSLSLLLTMLWGWRSSGACCYNLRQHLFIDSSLSFETVSSAAELGRKSPEYSAGQISWVNRRSAPINISWCTCIQSLLTSIHCHCWIQFIQRQHLNYVRKWHKWMNKSLHTLPAGSHLSREPGIQLTKLRRPHSLLQSGSSHTRHGRTHRE